MSEQIEDTTSNNIGLLELILLYSKHLKYIESEVGEGYTTYFGTRVTPLLINTFKKRIDQLKVMYQEPWHLREAYKLNGRIEGATK